MTLLISYTNYYGAHVFFLPGAHSMLKPALGQTHRPVNYYERSTIEKDGEDFL